MTRDAIVYAVVAIGLTLLTLVVTPRSELNGGLGYDGRFYARMVDDLRGGAVAVPANYAPRLLPSALVAFSGMDTRAGFLTLSVLGSVATLVLLAMLLASSGARAPLVVLVMVWVATLPPGLRYFMYQPVLVDASSTAFMVALIVLATRRKVAFFGSVLPFAMLTRETLLALVPFLWLALRPRRRAAWIAALAAVPGLAVYAVARALPPYPVDQFLPMHLLALKHVIYFALNIDDAQFTDHFLRFVAAIPVDFGVLAVLPVLWWRESIALLRRQPQWSYLIAATLVLAVVGGYDYDRYLFPLFVPLAVLTVAGARARALPQAAWIGITALHVAGVRYAWPLGADEPGALAFFTATMPLHELLVALAVALACLALAVAVAVAFTPRLRSAPATIPAA